MEGGEGVAVLAFGEVRLAERELEFGRRALFKEGAYKSLRFAGTVGFCIRRGEADGVVRRGCKGTIAGNGVSGAPDLGYEPLLFANAVNASRGCA